MTIEVWLIVFVMLFYEEVCSISNHIKTIQPNPFYFLWDGVKRNEKQMARKNEKPKEGSLFGPEPSSLVGKFESEDSSAPIY